MSSSEDEANRRRHARVQIALLVQYRFGALDEPRIDYALDVSQSGLFIKCDTEHPVGTRVFVQLTTRDGAHFLQGEGKVARASDGGYAIELVGFADEDQAVLDQLVKETLDAQGALGVGRTSKSASDADDAKPA